MKLEGEHIFKGPRQDVWDMFLDPEVLASALPGAEAFNKLSDQEYDLAMNIRIGPVSGRFTGNLKIADEVPPESCTLIAEGKGAPGFLKGQGDIKLTDLGDGTTHFAYLGDVNIGGALASVGQRMIDSVAKSMLRAGFDTLDKALEAQLAAKVEGTTVEYVPSTETDYVKSVAKDVVGGLNTSAESKLMLYILPLVAVLVVIMLLLSNCGG